MITLLVTLAAALLFTVLGIVAVKDSIWRYKMFGGEFLIGDFVLIAILFVAASLFGTITTGMVMRL